MPTRISDAFKLVVIQQWLEGIAPDTIAANNDLSAGGVTNFINEWKQTYLNFQRPLLYLFLQKYGSIKSATEQLSQEEDKQEIR